MIWKPSHWPAPLPLPPPPGCKIYLDAKACRAVFKLERQRQAFEAALRRARRKSSVPLRACLTQQRNRVCSLAEAWRAA